MCTCMDCGVRHEHLSLPKRPSSLHWAILQQFLLHPSLPKRPSSLHWAILQRLLLPKLRVLTCMMKWGCLAQFENYLAWWYNQNTIHIERHLSLYCSTFEAQVLLYCCAACSYSTQRAQMQKYTQRPHTRVFAQNVFSHIPVPGGKNSTVKTG